MNRTQAYYNAYKGHREALRAAWTAYNNGVAALEQYKGSAGYADDVKALAVKRDDAVKAARAKYAKDFDGVLAGMRLSMDYMPMPTVTDEQMNALAVLKMRSKVTRGELEQAARAVADNPVALGVVYEVAESNGYHGLRGVVGGESIDSARRCIDSLEQAARELVALDKVDARKERGIQAMRDVRDTGSGLRSLRGYRVDCDIDNVTEAMAKFGSVRDLNSFETFVNREL